MTDLPFGNTDIERESLIAQIDTDGAESALRKGKVENSSNELDIFISALPDLFDWLEANGRHYPWRYTTDPWKVYVTEILLQRTRGDAVETIFDQFFDKYPDPHSLNATSEEDIKETVSPLGFGNQRTRTLREVGEILVSDHSGEVPSSLGALKEPWRVGDYSARATLLFAFQQPEPLVDANIVRVIGRYFQYEMPRQPHKDTDVESLMESLTPQDSAIARAFYFSLLDLGALVCTPDEPNCDECPVASGCKHRLSQREKR